VPPSSLRNGFPPMNARVPRPADHP
jgi:hypothetical protein